MRSRPRGGARSRCPTLIAWGVIGVLTVLAAYVVYRILLRRSTIVERRGLGDADDDHPESPFAAALGGGRQRRSSGATEPEIRRPVDLAVEEEVGLFWDVRGMRAGCAARLVEASDQRVVVRVDSSPAPLAGRALLVISEPEGHVAFHEIEVTGAPAEGQRGLTPRDGRPAARLHRRCRSQVTLPAAAVATGANDDEPMAMRVHDVSLDGLGVLGETELTTGDVLIVRCPLPDHVEPLTLEGRVMWTQRDLAGICRAGLELEAGGVSRLRLADFMYSRLKAESSEIILQARRKEQEPVELEPAPERT